MAPKKRMDTPHPVNSILTSCRGVANILALTLVYIVRNLGTVDIFRVSDIRLLVTDPQCREVMAQGKQLFNQNQGKPSILAFCQSQKPFLLLLSQACCLKSKAIWCQYYGQITPVLNRDYFSTTGRLLQYFTVVLCRFRRCLPTTAAVFRLQRASNHSLLQLRASISLYGASISRVSCSFGLVAQDAVGCCYAAMPLLMSRSLPPFFLSKKEGAPNKPCVLGRELMNMIPITKTHKTLAVCRVFS